MAKTLYIGGSDGRAHEIPDMYLGGADGKARTIVKGYIGDANGKAQLFYQRKNYYTTTFHAVAFMTSSASYMPSSYESVDYTNYGCTYADSSNHCTMVPTLGTGSSSTFNWRFDNTGIPSDAKIVSVTARVKTGHSQAGYNGGNPWLRTYTGQFGYYNRATSTFRYKGTETDLRYIDFFHQGNTNPWHFETIDCGSPEDWTIDELRAPFLVLRVTRGSYYSYTEWDIDFYGCDFSVTYRA